MWYRVKEFYFDSRREQRQMTDAEYERALRELAGGRPIAAVIVDPSAASFLETLRRNGWNVRRADNDVLSGIRRTSDLLKCGRLVLCDTCTDCLREIEQYVWDPKAGARRRAQGARPCHGRHALFRLDGAGPAAPGPGRVHGDPEGVGVGAL